MIPFLLQLQYLFCSACLFIVSSKAQSMVFCYYCDIFDFFLPCMAARLPFDFLTPGIVGPMLCDNEWICCHSMLDLFRFCCTVCQSGCVQTHRCTQTHDCSSSLWLALIFWVCSWLFLPLCHCSHAVCSSDKPSAEVVCVSLHAVPLAYCFMRQCSTNYLMSAGRPAWATAHCTGMRSVCSHQVASLHVSR